MKMKKALLNIIAAILVNVTLGLAATPVPAADCAGGEWKCSGDAYKLMRCEGGAWKSTECMSAEGKLCEAGACVDPWRYGSPAWKTPQTDPLDTPETLAEKARYFEDEAARLQLNPKLKWITGVTLKCKPVACAPGQNEPCEDCSQPAAPEETATMNDVQRWDTHENDGLFSALYLAAEAFRYAVTRDPRALDMIRILLDGEKIRMKITGVPGIFTRQYIPPDVPGIACPDDPLQYTRAADSSPNTWLKVDAKGCVQYYDANSKTWISTKPCGLEEFAGWCWLDNVSKDEYSGHMFALGAVLKLVDDPQSKAIAADLLTQVANHLIKNKMDFLDWDGIVTPFGHIHALAGDDYYGFNAAMALDFIKLGAAASNDPKFTAWYDDCLLQKRGRRDCMKTLLEAPMPYTKHLPACGIYIGDEGCRMNYNNNSMHMLSLHNLIWFEHDPKLREIYQKSLDEDVFRAKGQPRALMFHNNAFFDIIFAAQKRLGPGSDGPAYDAVQNAVAMLRQMPARGFAHEVDCPPDKCKPYCKDRFNDDLGQFPRTAAQMCPGYFIWWDDPYTLISCKENKRFISTPTGFLLPYWMARYYGFITAYM